MKSFHLRCNLSNQHCVVTFKFYIEIQRSENIAFRYLENLALQLLEYIVLQPLEDIALQSLEEIAFKHLEIYAMQALKNIWCNLYETLYFNI